MSEWAEIAATFHSMTPEGRVEYMNKLADIGTSDQILKVLFHHHRKLILENEHE
jgi:hypothetical protein